MLAYLLGIIVIFALGYYPTCYTLKKLSKALGPETEIGLPLKLMFWASWVISVPLFLIVLSFNLTSSV